MRYKCYYKMYSITNFFVGIENLLLKAETLDLVEVLTCLKWDYIIC